MARPKAQTSAAGGAEATGERNVIVADDSVECANALAQHLRAAGHAVRVVYDGGAAVDAVLAEPPDAVFLDIAMPGRDGWEAAAAIRRALRGRPCLLVAVSGFADDVDRDRSAAAGFDHHLAKPADPAALLNLVASSASG
jgi:CheY-like chemotaxis protein